MTKNIKIGFILLQFAAIALLVACNNKEVKFDKNKWNIKNDMEYPFRRQMLNDLTTNYKLIGLNYSQLIELLGRPNYKDSISVAYIIVENYGLDIDPVYTKNLDFTFSKDSTITSFKVDEWKKK